MIVIVERKLDQILVSQGENTVEAARQADRAERIAANAAQGLMDASAAAQARIADQAEDAVGRAEAWAQGPGLPDPADPASRSARVWALQAAESSEIAEAFSGASYPDVTSGLAAVVAGGTFAVNNGGIVTIYRKEGGAAVAQRVVATTPALASTSGANLSGIGMDKTFDVGTVGAHMRWSPMPQDAPWLCDPTGAVDCTAQLQAYFDHCAANRLVATLRGRYRISGTITSNVRAIDGGAPYQDGSNPGSMLFVNSTAMADMQPALRIASGMGGVGAYIKGLGVIGDQGYTMMDAVTWCPDPSLLPSISAFARGPVGIELAGSSRPALRHCGARNLKIGIVYNVTGGHVASYESSFNGWLAGLYIKRNTEDFNFFGGQIGGNFCNILLGLQGGTIFTYSMHMGFSPYAIYQCEDGINPGTEIAGLGGILRGNFEAVGEAVICLLPNASVRNLTVERWGFSWSQKWLNWEAASPGGAWAYNLHPHILPYADQRKYALRLGIFYQSNILPRSGWGPLVVSSDHPNARIAYIASLPSRYQTDETNTLAFHQSIDVGGLRNNRWYNRYGSRVTMSDLQVSARVLQPNLLKNPEIATNWDRGMHPALTTLSAVGARYPQQMIDELGVDPVVLQLTASSVYSIQPFAPLAATPGRIVGFSLWSCGGTRLQYISRAGGTTSRAYSRSGINESETGWVKHVYTGIDHNLQIENITFDVGAGNACHIAGLMLFFDEVKPYSNSPSVKLVGLPNVATGLPAGSLWNNAGLLAIT